MRCLDKDASSVTIPSGGTQIGEHAFARCTSVSSVFIPEGVSRIGDWAFENCTSLSSIVLPEGLRSIGVSAFKNCTSLSEIAIPESVIGISDWGAFENCTSLSKITFGGTIEQWAAVQKGYFTKHGWHQGVPATVVHCSDGDANLGKA